MRFPWWVFFDRSWQRHSVGVLGLVVLLGLFFQWTKHEQNNRRREQWYWEQLVWSLVCGGVILVHANFHFGNMIASLACVFLAALVGNSAVIAIFHHTLTHATSTGEPRSGVPVSQFENLRLQRLLTLHSMFFSGCLVFSIIHILAILYY